MDVIKLYFGIGVEHSMSLEDIGEKFGLTRDKLFKRWFSSILEAIFYCFHLHQNSCLGYYL